MQAPAEPATGEMIFPGPPFPPEVPQNGGRAIFPPLPQKMPILFHSGNKRQFNLAPKVFQTTKTIGRSRKVVQKKSHFCLIPL